MRNIVLEISYNGDEYFGWQVQNNKRTVQGEITNQLKEILNEDIKLIGSGRTDAGVSAIKQVANFTTKSAMDCKTIKGRLNAVLPIDIKIINCYETNLNFNSQYNTKVKTYAYSFYFSETSIPYFDKIATCFKHQADMNVFEKELKTLVGVYDFSSFCASNTAVKEKTREIYNVKLINHQNNFYTVIISGNGFLYNMIRIIVGTLIDISREKIANSLVEVINFKDRKKAGFTASQKGLVLLDVEY